MNFHISWLDKITSGTAFHEGIKEGAEDRVGEPDAQQANLDKSLDGERQI